MTTAAGTTFDSIVGIARDSMIEQAEYARDYLQGFSRERIEEWMREQMHEIADSCVPVYNSEIMAVAADPRVWSQDTSDLGEPRNLIQGAQWSIYLAIEEALYDDASLLDAIEEIAGAADDDD